MKFYTLPELEKEINVNVRTLREYIKSGKLKASKIGRSYIIQEQDLIDFINNNKVSKK